MSRRTRNKRKVVKYCLSRLYTKSELYCFFNVNMKQEKKITGKKKKKKELHVPKPQLRYIGKNVSKNKIKKK